MVMVILCLDSISWIGEFWWNNVNVDRRPYYEVTINGTKSNPMLGNLAQFDGVNATCHWDQYGTITSTHNAKLILFFP